MATVVMVVSGANVWTMKNATPHPTGFWSEEFVTPHRKFTEAGLQVTVASPNGATPTVDPLSFNLSYNSNDAAKVAEQQDYMKRLGSALTSPMRVEDIDPDRFNVILPRRRPRPDAGHGRARDAWIGACRNARQFKEDCRGGLPRTRGVLHGFTRGRRMGVQGSPTHGLQQPGRDAGRLRRQRAVASGRPPPHLWRALHRKGAMDPARGCRWQPRNRPTELFGSRNRRRCIKTTLGGRVNPA